MAGRRWQGDRGLGGGGGLEIWLQKTLQGGLLKDLPPYYRLGKRVGQHPEQYARMLLAGLREQNANDRDLERTRDDGRAFRSWAESRPASAGRTDHHRSAC